MLYTFNRPSRSLSFSILISTFLAVSATAPVEAGRAQGGPAWADGNAGTQSADSTRGSLINYMRREHHAYRHYSDVRNAPSSERINGYEIYWDIEADDATHARRLKTHIEFMGAALEMGSYPRKWDKFFVIDAAMHKYVHTDVQVTGTRVQITKRADNACSYAIIKAHADVVSKEFFARGDTSVDHSPVADMILASSACDDYRDYLEARVSAHWQPR